MIDDKELEERADAYAPDNECVLERIAFFEGARSQDEIAYQRGRREVLKELVMRLGTETPESNSALFFGYLDCIDRIEEIIDQLKTGGDE